MSEKENKGLSTESYKGVRDFYPEDMAVQNYIYGVWREVAEKAGYHEYSASILEPAELYRQKSGDEIVNDQMYTFKDKGDREVALRPEMTPTLARMVAGKRKSLKFPLRWYSIPNLFRYERSQRGRRREHWQLNCDLIGVADIEGDIEIIKLAYAVMKAFGAKDENFVIRIGNRKIPNEIGKKVFQLDDESARRLLKIQDQKEKLEEKIYIDLVRKVFEDKFKSEERWIRQTLGKTWEDEADRFISLMNTKKIDELLSQLPQDETVSLTILETIELLKSLKAVDIKNAVFNQNLVRGFDYYTGVVFEVFDTNPENRRSLFGGGRYDNLLEMFGVEPVPAVGFGMGDVTIKDFLETHKLPLSKP